MRTQRGTMERDGTTPYSLRPPVIPDVEGLDLTVTEAFGGFAVMFGERFRTRLITHVHSTYVIGVVEAGSVEVTTRRDSAIAGTGSVIVIAPYEPHTEIAPSAEGWSFRYLYTPERVVRRALGIDGQDAESVLQPVTTVIDDERLAGMIAEAHRSASTGKPVAETESRLTDVLVWIRDRHCLPDAEASLNPTRAKIRQARQAIIDASPRRQRVQDIAKAAGLSEFHFNRLFREEVGLSVHAFFDRVRIAQAHDLIFQGHSPGHVAHLLGFADQPHFTRRFTRASVFTPGQFSHMRAWIRRVAG